jgi:hypothetical protein
MEGDEQQGAVSERAMHFLKPFVCGVCLAESRYPVTPVAVKASSRATIISPPLQTSSSCVLDKAAAHQLSQLGHDMVIFIQSALMFPGGMIAFPIKSRRMTSRYKPQRDRAFGSTVLCLAIKEQKELYFPRFSEAVSLRRSNDAV